MARRPWGRSKVMAAAVMLVFILLRLIWMQLQSFPVQPNARSLVTIEYLSKTMSHKCQTDVPQFDFSRSIIRGASTEADRLYLSGWLTTPGLIGYFGAACNGDGFTRRLLPIWNSWAIMVVVLACILACRFLTSSWMVSLVAGALIINTEAFFNRISSISIDAMVMVAYALWYASIVHFFRTAALTSLIFSFIFAFLGALCDPSLAGLFLVLPIFLGAVKLNQKWIARLVVNRGRHAKSEARLFSSSLSQRVPEPRKLWERFSETVKWMVGQGVPETPEVDPKANFNRGSLFASIRVPFGFWIIRKSRWRRLLMVTLVSLPVFIAVIFVLYRWPSKDLFGSWGIDLFRSIELSMTVMTEAQISNWLLELLEPFDLQVIISVAVVLVCAVQSPADGLLSFLESIWTFVLSVIVLLVCGFVFDGIDQAVISHYVTGAEPTATRFPFRQVVVWIHPIILTLGTAGIYNLIKVADSRMMEGP